MFHFSQLRFTYEKKTTEKKFRIFFTFTRFPDGKKEGHEKDYAGKTQFPFSCQVRNAGKKTIYFELELVNRSPGLSKHLDLFSTSFFFLFVLLHVTHKYIPSSVVKVSSH